jgi:hypothetical protein
MREALQQPEETRGAGWPVCCDPWVNDPSHHVREQPEPRLIATHVVVGLFRCAESSPGVGVGEHGITDTTVPDPGSGAGQRSVAGVWYLAYARSLLQPTSPSRLKRVAMPNGASAGTGTATVIWVQMRGPPPPPPSLAVDWSNAVPVIPLHVAATHSVRFPWSLPGREEKTKNLWSPIDVGRLQSAGRASL